jgi:hypothetical protein
MPRNPPFHDAKAVAEVVHLLVDVAFDTEGKPAGVLKIAADASETPFDGWLELLVAIRRAPGKHEGSGE